MAEVRRSAIDWTARPSVDIACPVCEATGSKPFVLSAYPSWSSTAPLALYACKACASKFFPYLKQPAYETPESEEAYLKFYVEVGAGVDQLVRPLFSVPLKPTDHYLEIGCGFGFAIDFAKRMLGLTAIGVDPSPFARAGAHLLGIPIVPQYLEPHTDLGATSFELAVASEVIEHIFEARAFIRGLRERLSPDGVLFVTTPNAARVTPDANLGNLIPLLSAGWHCILYSEQGLRRVLSDAGFRRVEVIVRGHTLVAAATNGEKRIDLTAQVDRDCYRNYLEERYAAAQARDDLRHGFGYRLLKELTNSSAYQRAIEVYDELRHSFQQKYQFDIEQEPETWLVRKANESFDSFASRYPLCLCGVAYYRGIIALDSDEPDKAIHYFVVAERFGAMLRESLHAIGSDDAETEELAGRGSILALRAQAYRSPMQAAAGALEQWRASRDRAEQFVGERNEIFRIFSHLVKLGALEAARSMVAEVEKILRDRPKRLDREAAEFRFEMQMSLGTLELNHGPQARAAAYWFARAEQTAKRLVSLQEPDALSQVWRARRERLLAWLVGGSINRAMLVAQLWHRRGGMYAIPREKLLRLLLEGIVTDTSSDTEESRAHAARLVGLASPSDAARRALFRPDSVPSLLEQEALAGSFLHLVNCGLMEIAEPLVPVCENYLVRIRKEHRPIPQQLCFDLRRALGVLELNLRHNPHGAALHFALAERVGMKLRATGAEPTPEFVWRTRHDRVLAWVIAGNKRRASLAGSRFVHDRSRELLPRELDLSTRKMLADVASG